MHKPNTILRFIISQRKLLGYFVPIWIRKLPCSLKNNSLRTTSTKLIVEEDFPLDI